MRQPKWWCGAVALGFMVAMGAIPHGHTPIDSRWNFNEHIFPVFAERCGGCHIDGGVAPMSLVDYQSAFPWTQSIREEILGLRMPPWQAEDEFGGFRNGHSLSAQEMNMILEWSSGGYPEGPRDQTPELPVSLDTWSLGEPTLVLEMPEPFDLDAGTSEAVRYFVLPSGVDEDRSILGAELNPGARAVVRGAAIFVDATGTARSLDEADEGPGFADAPDLTFPTTPPFAVWSPGQPSVLNQEFGYVLPAGADVILRIHYKKTWITEGMNLSDRSQVGLHLSDGRVTDIASMVVTSPAELSGGSVTFTHEMTHDATVLSLLPEVDIEASELVIEAMRPDGVRVPMLWLREPDRGWPTRFWFDVPLFLPAGTQLEVMTRVDPGAERLLRGTLIGEGSAPIRLGVAYVTEPSAAN